MLGTAKIKTNSTRGYFWFLVPGLLCLVLVVLLPFFINIYFSFTKWTGVGIPSWVGLSNYHKAFSDAVFWASFRNNLLMIFAVTVLPAIMGLMLATFLFDYASKTFGNKAVSFFRAGFYLPQILPVAIAGIVWGWILDPSHGALNSLFELLGFHSLIKNWLGDPSFALPSVMGIMLWFQLGYPLVVFMSALQRVDPQIMEAAAIDGAGWFRRFSISLYIIRPEIIVVLLTTTIYALKLFAPIYVLTRGGPGRATIVPSYFAYQNFFEKAQVGYGSAISSIMTLIILLLTIFFIKIQLEHEAVGES